MDDIPYDVSKKKRPPAQYPGPPEYVEQVFTIDRGIGQPYEPGVQEPSAGMDQPTYHSSGLLNQPYPPYNQQYPPMGNHQQPYPPMGRFNQPPYPPTGIINQQPYIQPGMQPNYPPSMGGMQPYNQMGVFNGGMYLDPEEPNPVRQGDPTLALNFLATVSKLEIRQKIEILELFTNFETPNKYTILNEDKQPVFFAMEVSDCCSRQCCGPQRPLDVQIIDMFQTEVIHLSRPLRCQSCLYPCCLQILEVSSPPGTLVSTIEQCWSLWPSFDVKDAFGNIVLKISGPFCTTSCCCKDVKFDVLSAEDDSYVGQITKKYTGFTQEYFTDADTFEVSFPQDLEVSIKAALLGAVFLLDMMYYETPPNNQNR